VISIIFALYFSLTKSRIINKNYFYLIVLIGFITIILTGSRGWIISLALVLLGAILLLVMSREIAGFMRLAAVGVIVIFFIISMLPAVQEQIQLSFQRVGTLEAIAEGDLSADGTLARLDMRSPRVMNKFRENPILGWGFSNEYYEYYDVHVGHQSILLNTGILGYIYLNVLFFYLLLKIWNMAKMRQIKSDDGYAFYVYILGLIFIYVIHSSSTQLWGYTLSMVKMLFIGFFFASVNAAYVQNSQETNKD
jgi:O-antigen ligase